MISKKLLGGVALGAVSLLFSGPAHAQSTASQQSDDAEATIVVTGQARRTIDGAISAEQVARARASITQEFISTQSGGQTILETLSLVPGAQFNNNDAYGSSGGDLTLRGFDGARISLQFDGIPLNDTGNYAIYSNQQMDPELIQRANVNLGTTEVDSPTASATGGTVNYITAVPTEDFGVDLGLAVGSENYERIFLRGDTGEIGPLGTSIFVAGSYQQYDQFVGPGDLEKKQFNARIYQPVGDNGDFMSVSFHYNENRNNFYRTTNLANFNAGIQPVNDDVCVRPLPGPGVQRETTTPTGTTPLCTNYYNLRINPSNTGNIRGQSRFTIMDGLQVTFDPTYQFVRANGGGVQAVAENDARLIGASAAAGVDLNGDGDLVDRIMLYSPSNTTTNRYGFTSSLIWDINDSHQVRVGYTFDRGRHRQTGEYDELDQFGNPLNVFGGREGFGTPILTADGEIFQKRDRFSIASLEQWSAEYRGDFLDDLVTVTLGVRAPEFERELNQYCFAAPGSSGDPTCTSGAGPAGAVAPFTATVTYDDILPNVGVTLRPFDGQQIFFSYAEGLSAPRTDDLYSGLTIAQLDNVQPETTSAYDLGYRYQRGRVLASATVWYTQFENRIVRSFDPDEGITLSRNVGSVDMQGVDAALGFRVTEALSLYGSAAYTETEVDSTGFELVEIPDWTASLRAQYERGPFVLGLQVRYTGDRFANDNNTQVAPSYTVVNADIRWNLGDMLRNENTYLQLNVINLFDEDYLGVINSASGTGNASFLLGAPQTIQLQLRAEF
jgi:iron complex outermembrane receptor protein